MKKGGLGKAWIDDVSMTPYVADAFGGVFCDAYRNAASSGKVLFRVPVNVDGGAVATFSWKDETGKAKSRKVEVTEKECVGFKELHARRLVESVGYVVMGYLLLGQATEHPNEYLTSAQVMCRMGAGKVAEAAAVVASSTAEDVALYKF